MKRRRDFLQFHAICVKHRQRHAVQRIQLLHQRPDFRRIARFYRSVKQRLVAARRFSFSPSEHLVACVDGNTHQPWPDGPPISQRAQVRVGALRRIGHGLFRVAIRSKHHPRHAKHSGAILTNRLHKALVAPSLVLHIHPSFRFLRIAIHHEDARDAKKSAS